QQTVNKPYYDFGKGSENDSEIVIDVNTAARLQLKVGDSYHFLNKSYYISGIAAFPAQIQPNMKLTGFGSYQPEAAALIELSDESFEQINSDEKFYYSATWLEQAANRELEA